MSRQARLDSPGTLHHVWFGALNGGGLPMTRGAADFVRRLGALLGNRYTDYAWALPQIVSRGCAAEKLTHRSPVKQYRRVEPV